MTPTYKIVIIGAGPGGCTLAHLLRKAEMDVTIFEGETSSKVRTQGGTLDLHTKTGIAVLKECDLYTEFQKHARYDGEAKTISDKHNRRYLNLEGSSNERNSHGRPEIDRGQLRDLLANPLTKDGITKWNHRLKLVDEKGTLHFTSGTTIPSGTFDLVIGADGAWSKVHAHLTDSKPTYAGVSGFDAQIPNAAKTHPLIYDQTKRGTWAGYGDGKSITCQQMGNGAINVYFWNVYPEEWTDTFSSSSSDSNGLDVKAIRQALHAEYVDWAPIYHDLIEAVDSSTFIQRKLYHHSHFDNNHKTSGGIDWMSREGFTLLGDAAHLMTPFAGEGVNSAMADALDLASAISTASAANAVGSDGLAPHIAAFETRMRKRMRPIQRRAELNMRDMFTMNGSPGVWIERFVVRNVVDELGCGFWIPVVLVVYVYFWFVKVRIRGLD